MFTLEQGEESLLIKCGQVVGGGGPAEGATPTILFLPFILPVFLFFFSVLGLLLVALSTTQAFYSPSDGIVELNPTNFDSLVTKSDEIWVVEFYAPW